MEPIRVQVLAAMETRNYTLVHTILEKVKRSSKRLYKSLVQDIRESYYT